MLKESTNPQKYLMIREFLPEIVQSIRRDLRLGHLKQDKNFLKEYFQGKNPNKLSVEELAAGYAPLLEAGNEKLWDFFIERWLLKYSDIYYFFENRIEKIDQNFTELDSIEYSKAQPIAEEAAALFGSQNTYIFCVLNCVVFPEKLYEEMKEAALKSKPVVNHESVEEELKQPDYLLELKRVQNKYEKKLLGLQKLYDRDVAALKKQITSLQKKLEALL